MRAPHPHGSPVLHLARLTLLSDGRLPVPELSAGLRHFTEHLQSQGVEFAPNTAPEQRTLAGPTLGASATGAGIADLQAMAHSPEISRVLEGPEVFSFFGWLFGEPAGTLDWKWVRVVPPGRRGGFHMGASHPPPAFHTHHHPALCASLVISAHAAFRIDASADNVYMGRGSDRLCTVWVPWSDVPVEHGGLVVLRGSNSLPGFERNPHEHF